MTKNTGVLSLSWRYKKLPTPSSSAKSPITKYTVVAFPPSKKCPVLCMCMPVDAYTMHHTPAHNHTCATHLIFALTCIGHFGPKRIQLKYTTSSMAKKSNVPKNAPSLLSPDPAHLPLVQYQTSHHNSYCGSMH